jgi:hypothetical protein
MARRLKVSEHGALSIRPRGGLAIISTVNYVSSQNGQSWNTDRGAFGAAGGRLDVEDRPVARDLGAWMVGGTGIAAA